MERATTDEDEAVRKAATGTLALLRPDPYHSIHQPAKPLNTPQAKYPPDVFVSKFEGTVVVEILINTQGRVVRAVVKKSIPGRLSKQMDAAALAARAPVDVRARPESRQARSRAQGGAVRVQASSEAAGGPGAAHQVVQTRAVSQSTDSCSNVFR